jgi:hypothetical protein
MDIKETQLKTLQNSTVLDDIEYYKYIFKKTEKIACAVFYVLRADAPTGHTDVVRTDLETAARVVLDTSLESLKSTARDREARMSALRHALMALESKLRLASAARFLNTELLEVFIHEIDTVYRSLRKYTESVVSNPLAQSESVPEVARMRPSVRTAQVERLVREKRDAFNDMPSVPASRRDRVLTVIRDRGEATIKDITEVIKDCSEKTIQRELISLIKDNSVTREGDRRWSKYKLV